MKSDFGADNAESMLAFNAMLDNNIVFEKQNLEQDDKLTCVDDEIDEKFYKRT